MTTIRNFRLTPAAFVLGAALACSSVFAGTGPKATPAATAATTAAESPQARYQQERSACLSGATQQDQKTCLREAGAAYDQARRGALTDKGATYDANQRKRCEVLPASDRPACLARMDGKGVAVGSAQAGGIYRELTVVEQAPVAAVPLAPENNEQSAEE